MKKTCFLLLTFVATIVIYAQESKRPDPQLPVDTYEKFKVGMAGYTFVKFDFGKTLKTLQRIQNKGIG